MSNFHNQNNPMPMMFPVLMSPQEKHSGPSLSTNEVPARVRVAVEYLKQLTFKTMPQIAANEVGFETIDGQQLTQSETDAQASAAVLLRDYFAGSYTPDDREEKDAEVARRVDQVLGQRGLSVPCFQCHCDRMVMRNCPVCRGTGKVLVFPDG